MIKMSAPLVSIVIPCYNASSSLKMTLLSVKDQDYSNYEVILVDDGSNDDTPYIIHEFEKSDKRFQGIRQNNRGVSSARNRGIELANSEYVAFLDADDLFMPNSIIERMNFLIRHDDDNLLGVFCPAILIDMNCDVLRKPPIFHYPHEKIFFSTTPECLFNPSSVIAKKNKILEAGGFDEKFAHSEDYNLWHKMMRKGGYFKEVNSCYICYMQHKYSAAHTKILKHYKQWKDINDKIFSEDPTAIKELRFGYGKSLQYSSLTRRAFAYSIIACIMKQEEVLNETISDISKFHLKQIDFDELAEIIKFNALRTLCRPEEEWLTSVLPSIKNDLINFLGELYEKFGKDCNNLLELICSFKDMEMESLTSEGIMSSDKIEILSLNLLKKHQNLKDSIYKMSDNLKLPLGWHYILDLTWIISNLGQLPKGSTILDAGAGNGLLQFLLANMGYKIISVDFSPRTPPQTCKNVWNIIPIDNGIDYDNEYIKHLKENYSVGHVPIYNPYKLETQNELYKLLESTYNTIIYYRSDFTDMRLIKNDSIDCIVSVSALEHNDHKTGEKAVEEFARVLKPRGKMLITVSASLSEDWFHEPSKGWCYCEASLKKFFGLNDNTRSNFQNKDILFQLLKNKDNELNLRLADFYFASGNNGMPWGIWNPQYLPVGISKFK
jgi:glycosyltransferase involved in cell wall biosynthesis